MKILFDVSAQNKVESLFSHFSHIHSQHTIDQHFSLCDKTQKTVHMKTYAKFIN